MNATGYLWITFAIVLLAMLTLDLGVFHRKAPQSPYPRGSGVLGRLDNALIRVQRSYLLSARPCDGHRIPDRLRLEWSLSIDNMFVFAMIFTYFAMPPQYQHRLLFYGILGAVVTRLPFILAGVTLLGRFRWMIYLIGGFLVLTEIKQPIMWGKNSSRGNLCAYSSPCLLYGPSAWADHRHVRKQFGFKCCLHGGAFLGPSLPRLARGFSDDARRCLWLVTRRGVACHLSLCLVHD